jgi:hypothetical protein
MCANHGLQNMRLVYLKIWTWTKQAKKVTSFVVTKESTILKKKTTRQPSLSTPTVEARKIILPLYPTTTTTPLGLYTQKFSHGKEKKIRLTTVILVGGGFIMPL